MSPTTPKTTVNTKKDDLPGRKGAKKTPTDGKVSKKKSASSTDKKSNKKKMLLNEQGEMVPYKKPRRFRPGTVAEREIRRYQKSNSPELLVPKVALYRLVKELMGDIGDYRLSREAAYALRLAYEGEAVRLLAGANRMATHASRVTIMLSDFDAVTDVRSLFPDGSTKDRKHNARYLEAREKRLKLSMEKNAKYARRETLKDRVQELSTVDEASIAGHGDANPTGYD